MVVELGDTVTLAPFPTKAPPQVPAYHCQLAPVPKEPPLTFKVVLPPGHTLNGLALADDGVEEVELTVIVANSEHWPSV